MIRIIALGWAAALTVGFIAAELPAQEPRPVDFEGVIAGARGRRAAVPSPFRDFNEVTKGAEKIEGLFTLYKTGDHLYGEIRARSVQPAAARAGHHRPRPAQAGHPVGDDEMVLIFKRVGDRIQLVRRNIHYKAPPGSSLDKAVKQNYTDSVLMALPIIALNPMRGGAALIDFSDIFMTDFAQLGLGMLDRSRSSWTKVKGFPNNMELEVEATFSGGGRRHVTAWAAETASPTTAASRSSSTTA